MTGAALRSTATATPIDQEGYRQQRNVHGRGQANRRALGVEALTLRRERCGRIMWLAGVSATATLVAMLSGLATIGSFFAYLYTARRSNANAARDEALALAETRRQVIADLRRQNARSERRVRELERELEDLRANARDLEDALERMLRLVAGSEPTMN